MSVKVPPISTASEYATIFPSNQDREIRYGPPLRPRRAVRHGLSRDDLCGPNDRNRTDKNAAMIEHWRGEVDALNGLIWVRWNCPFRKSYPDVLAVQPGQDWDGDNDTGPVPTVNQIRIY